MELWGSSPTHLITAMLDSQLQRGFLITGAEGEVHSSAPLLQPMAERLRSDCQDYDGHAAVFFELGSESGHLLAAFIHQTRRGQAAGGVRFSRYETVADLLRDGLRLSRGMGLKNALAGLWWGGGKGVIARLPGVDHLDPHERASIYRDYGRFMSGLRGCYVAAEDAGTSAEDMAWVHRTTRYATCVPTAVGGSGNPSAYTAKGVVIAMEAALERRGQGGLEGKTVVSQGLGNVAHYLVGELLHRGVKSVVAADVKERTIEDACHDFRDERVELRKVSPGDDTLLSEPCDIFTPNARGGILNPTTIPTIAAGIVCGAANNQLEQSGRDDVTLASRGILYVPDFLANRMGIVHCANEQYGSLDADPLIEMHLDRDAPGGIFRRAWQVFERAEASGRTPAAEAECLAEELSAELHPIWGDRGADIIAALQAEDWAAEPPIGEGYA